MTFIERLWSPKENKFTLTNCEEVYAHESKELEDYVISAIGNPLCTDGEEKTSTFGGTYEIEWYISGSEKRLKVRSLWEILWPSKGIGHLNNKAMSCFRC